MCCCKITLVQRLALGFIQDKQKKYICIDTIARCTSHTGLEQPTHAGMLETEAHLHINGIGNWFLKLNVTDLTSDIEYRHFWLILNEGKIR